MKPEQWQRVQDVYLDAADQDEAQRSSFLDHACAGDPELRTEVESLLRADAIADPVLDATMEELVLLMENDGSGDTPQRAGPYRIEAELGRGGMGTVFRAAREDDGYDRIVALKIVSEGRADAATHDRFRREQQILAGLEHSHIARMYDAGVSDDGRPWIAMELVDGVPIHRYCDERKLDIDARLRLFEQVCAAVEYAHRNLVIHRDLKPSNILVTPDGVVKLLDFGIAKLLSDDTGRTASTREPLTQMQHRVLTPEYASPEQLDGRPLTTTSDVFSLGVVLHLLLTGRAVQRGDDQAPHSGPSTLVLRTTAEVDGATVEELARTRGCDPPTLKRRLAGELDLLLLKAMRAEPEERYLTAAALLDDLVRYREGQPLVARAPSFTYRAGKFIRRNRVPVAAASAVLITAIGGAGLLAVQQSRTADQRDRAELEAQRANEVTAFLLDMFVANDPGQALGDSVTVREILDRASERVMVDLADQPELQSRLLQTMGDVYRGIGRMDDSRRLLERAMELYDDEVIEDPAAEADAANRLGILYDNLGEYEAAESLYRRALALRQDVLEPPDTELSEILHNLGLTLGTLSRTDEAEGYLSEAVSMDSALMVGDTSGALGYSLNSLAILHYQTGDLSRSADVFEEALDIRRRTYGELHPRVATTLGNLGAILTISGDHHRAIPFLRQTLDMNRQIHGASHPDIANSLHNLASSLSAIEAWDEAEPLLREAMAMNIEALGPDHPEVALNLNSLGRLYRDRGDLAAAESLLIQADELATQSLPDDDFRRAIVAQSLGSVRAMDGRCEEALLDFRRAVRINTAGQGVDHYRTAAAESEVASCLAAVGREPEAEAILLRTYPLLIDQLGADADESRRVRAYLRTLYSGLGRMDEAARYSEPSGS